MSPADFLARMFRPKVNHEKVLGAAAEKENGNFRWVVGSRCFSFCQGLLVYFISRVYSESVCHFTSFSIVFRCLFLPGLLHFQGLLQKFSKVVSSLLHVPCLQGCFPGFTPFPFWNLPTVAAVSMDTTSKLQLLMLGNPVAPVPTPPESVRS